MRSLLLAALMALPFFSVAARAEVVVRVSKSTQTMQVWVNGDYAYEWPFRPHGRDIRRLRAIRPQRLEKRWFSQKYDNAPMHNAVFFHGGYAIHGTPHVGQLGRPASHGCIRLAPGNAAELFSLIKKYGPQRTRIMIR